MILWENLILDKNIGRLEYQMWSFWPDVAVTRGPRVHQSHQLGLKLKFYNSYSEFYFKKKQILLN